MHFLLHLVQQQTGNKLILGGEKMHFFKYFLMTFQRCFSTSVILRLVIGILCF